MIIRITPALRLAGPKKPLIFRPATAITTLANQQRLYSNTSSERATLSYDLHKPARPVDAAGPILFLHGLFGSKKNNRSISKALARDLGRSVYTLDARNHGDSSRHEQHDYTSMADDVAHFIQEHELKDSTLIGHSMGAKTVMAVALKYPRLVKDLIPVDNAPVDAAILSDFGKYVQGLKKVEAADCTKQAEADKILEPYEKELPIRQFLLGNLHRPDAGSNVLKFKPPLDILGKSLDKMGDFPFKDPSQARFEGRVLVVRGTESKYVPDDMLPVFGQFFPRFEVADVKAGHWVISENPEGFRQAVVRFLAPDQ